MWGHPSSGLVIGDSNSTSIYNTSKTDLTLKSLPGAFYVKNSEKLT